MRVLLIALLAAISYAQTERRSLAERRSAVRRRLYEHEGIDSDAAAKMAGADGETTVDLVIIHDDLELGDNAKERCHLIAVEFCESIGAHDDVHAVNCEPHEIAEDSTYIGPDVITEDTVYYCGQYVYDVHPDEIDTIEVLLDQIDNSDSKLHISENHHDYSYFQNRRCSDGNSNLWHLKAMNPNGMNNFRSNQGIDGEGTIAYIIDTGVNRNHADFEGRVVGGWNIVDNNNDFADIDGHGTHVAGSVAGRTSGVAPNALIWGVQVFFPVGNGRVSTGDSLVGQALQRIVEKVTRNNEKAVVNMSLGGPGRSSNFRRTVDAAVAAGVNVVVAAGNDNANACNYSPAFVDSAVTVGAYGQRGSGFRWAPFSNWGSCVDISAPGMQITGPSHRNNNGFINLAGTSMAAPHVAGVIATIMSRTGVSNPQTVKWMLLGGQYSADLSNVVSGIPGGTTSLFAMQPCIERENHIVPTGPPDGSPIITTTSAQPIVTEFFRMSADKNDCTVSGNCVSSMNFPRTYGNNQECLITITSDVSVSADSSFSLEARFDKLEINNVDIRSRTSVPSSLNSGSTIEWDTDSSVTRTGWRLCFSGNGPPGDGGNPGTRVPDPTTTTGSPNPTVFSVSGTGCTVTFYGCVSSKNWPDHYGNGETCTITMTQNARLSVMTPYELERNYDHLRVNGASKWSAGEIPQTLNSGGTIEWRSDGSITRDGWKICFSANNGGGSGPPPPGDGGSNPTTLPDTTTTRRVTTTTRRATTTNVETTTTRASNPNVFGVTGSGCTVTSQCVSSKNWPGHYGNRESCTVMITQNARLQVMTPYELERNYDFLRVNNAPKWSASSIPQTLNSGSRITWSSDGSVTRDGWKICFSANGGGGGGGGGAPPSNPSRFGSRQNGYCVLSNGRDQNSQVTRSSSSFANSNSGGCLNWCETQSGLTGCEYIWGQRNRGCYAHRATVSRGNGVSRHYCWIANTAIEKAIGDEKAAAAKDVEKADEVLVWNILENPTLNFTMNAFALIGVITIVATIGKFALHKYHVSNYKEIEGEEEI